MLNKLKAGLEGLIIAAIGVFLLINSIQIKNNPIPLEGMAGVLTQAKFMPIVMSAGITVLGIVLFIKQLRGLDESNKMTKAEWTRTGIVLVLTAAYIIAVYMFKFLIPTIVYAFAIIFFLNWKSKKIWEMVVFAILVIVLGIYGMPALISLRLPMM